MKQLLFMSLRAPIKSGRGNLYSVIPHLMQNLYRYLLVWIPAFAGMTMVWFALFPSPAFAANSGIFTVELWVKPTSTIASQALVGKAEELRVFTDSSGYAGCQIKSTTWQTAATGTQGLTLQGWNHVACTYDKSNLTVYVNGVLTKQQALTATIDDTANALLIGQDSSASTPYSNLTGTTDDFKFYNYARTQKQIVSDMGGGAPAVIAGGAKQSGPVGYWKFDEGYGTTANNSGSQGDALRGTLSGFASPATSTSGWTQSGKFGKALIFDGSNDKITIPSAASLKGLGAATISVWYKPTANPSANAALYYESTATTGYTRFGVYHNSNGDLLAGMRDTDSGSILSATKTAPFTNGQWYHIVTTVDANTDQLLLYLNGVLVASNTTTKGSFTTGTSADSIAVGAYTGSTAAYINGTIDEVKIYNYALTADEVKLDYNRSSSMVLGSLSDNSSYQTQAANQEYCVPGDSTSCAAPVGRWDFEEKSGQLVYDTSGNGFSATLGANSSTGSDDPTWAIGKYGGGLSFDGSDDTVTYATSGSSALDISNASVSLSAWVNISPQETNGDIAGKCFASVYGYGMRFDNTLQVSIRNSTTNATYSSDTVVSKNQWNFVAATIEDTGSSTTIRFYINGQLVKTTTGAIRIGNNNTNPIQIGGDCWRSAPAANNTLLGKIDAVRIYNYVRTPAQIAWDYNRGAPVGHWKFDECQGATANDSSGNSNTGTITIGASGTQTAVGTCTTSSTAWGNGVTGKRNYSLNFDGTDDYVSMPAGSTFRTQNGSISLWAKRNTSDTSSQGVWEIYTDNSNRATLFWSTSTSKWAFAIRNTASGLKDVFSNNTFTDSNWHHLIGTWGDNGLNLYIDGKLQSDTDPSTIGTDDLGTTTSHAIGKSFLTSDNLPFTGQIDDVRIYNYALTATQVKTLYNNGAVNFAPSTGSP